MTGIVEIGTLYELSSKCKALQRNFDSYSPWSLESVKTQIAKVSTPQAPCFLLQRSPNKLEDL